MNVKKSTLKIWWAITIVIMIIGIAAGFATDLTIDTSGDNIRYTSSSATPLWANLTIILLSFATIMPVIICCMIQIVNKRSMHLFLAGFLMLVFSMIVPAIGHNEPNFLITIFVEIFMVIFYYLAVKKNIKN